MLLLSASTASIPATPLPEATAIKLDGAFTEAIWEHVPSISDFRQRDPKDGAAPTFATDVQVAYDASNLYVAVRAHDPEPHRLVSLRTRRDTDSPSDWLKVIVDSFHDKRTAFEFGVNPAGVKEDRAWSNDGNDDGGWDAVWDVAVSRDKEGWRAEFRIPFSQLRFNPSDDATFGFAVVRQIGRLNETDTWPLISKSANGFVSNFGDLTHLKLAQTPKRLELVPYVVGQVNTQPAETGNPLVSTRDQKATVGADLKYALKPGVTLTATVNPDFGQVEADPAVVNLSGFETFFNERRPFFIEGAGNFAFNLDCNDGACSGLFYSRRIGRAPRGYPALEEGMYARVPQQTKILGAAKLTGRMGKFSFGALNATTADEQAVIAGGADGSLRTRQSVEPLSNYSVVRARREFANQSSVGFMATGTARRLDSFTNFLPDQALTGGVDWDVRMRKRYAVQGYWIGSTVHGDADAIRQIQESTVHSFQRPDADHVELDPTRTSLNGNGGSVSFSKIAGSKVRFSSNTGYKSPGLDINDVGFMRRADLRSQNNWIQFRNDTPTKHRRSFRWNLNQWGTWNNGGDRLDLGGNINAHWTFTNEWSTGMGFNMNARNFDDRATRGVGPGAYYNANLGYWGYVNSDERKPINASTFFNTGSDRRGTHWAGVSPGVTMRPTSFLSVSTGVDWNHNVQDAQWVENTADGRYVFGRLDQTTVSLTLRVNYTITPNLTVQIYAAPFVSAGDYDGFKQLVDGRAAAYEDRYAPVAYAGNPDFNYRSFRTTNVLRWEYKPGSALFVVWQQGREDVLDAGRFRFGPDFNGVFGAPARNAFLVKWSYWINQ
ncbi:MAG TPA: DUF5916 domain-containing protein [Vicinamibacterales bacterium]|nr:DUF5916 domain-containing protein [Vicinamibacterales bacterium]